MTKVIISGGGWAGCAAAIAALKQGAEVSILERTDMLLGSGLVGGIMRNNGRYTAAEEAINMGGGDLFKLIDETTRHKNVDFPGHQHASLYDIASIEPVIRDFLVQNGVQLHLNVTARDVNLKEDKIESLITGHGEVQGDVFIDTTGTAGPMKNCIKYGNGCAQCIYRCSSFGERVSITAQAGIQEITGKNSDGTQGAMSGSCKLLKDSLSEDIVHQLDSTGTAIVSIPQELLESDDFTKKKACQQYALKEYYDNIILLDTGHAKLMTPFFPIEYLRKIPGFEKARFEDPYAGGVGNSIRYMALAPRDNYLNVQGIKNLFCAGEKSGLLVGHTEAIITGTLAGFNAVRYGLDDELIEIPRSTMCGEAIAYVGEQMTTEEGRAIKYTFSGSVLFDYLNQWGYYTTDHEIIEDRIEQAGFKDIFK
ncbi:FAD-dependent oxidoreductase [Natranaerobius thermophilus]|uniref:Glucose-inhibited division protein A n=1 Tax=Natranaerobius thermophilus (strain ATCC BAA-1301 / DSM 18059 / JW/NM-WN-LF) TaxID=457570 RepID=B2A235_NATTJ|nr:FAD-dependent oxidoreductase [Natranaerobius thermophilus]ACB84840.1 glucose-inhibited division protein A [Natranaerobius thermophilus JW/NM-WN-LF]